MKGRGEFNLEIGSYLRELRLKAQVTQRQAAERLGHKTSQQISNIERGSSPVTMSSLPDLLDLYGADLKMVIETLLQFYKKYLEKQLL